MVWKGKGVVVKGGGSSTFLVAVHSQVLKYPRRDRFNLKVAFSRYYKGLDCISKHN